LPADQVVQVGGDAVPYHRLIIATGGDARMLPGGEHLEGVHVLRTLDDAIAVRAALDAGARTVVVGAGFIGSEVASAARKRGLSCTVLEALPVPLVRSVGVDTGKVAAELHRSHGTDLRCGVGVTALEGSGRVEKVILDDGTVIEADLVVVGIGVRPATGWLQSSGIALHERDGGILCDEYLRTSLPGVYAAGDVAHFPNPLFDGEMMRVEQWTNAAEQGALAAKNALHPDEAKPSAAVPYFWSDWYDSRIQFVGIPQSEEVRVVSAELGEEKFLALYRRGAKLGGVLTVDRQTQIMKYKRMIAQGASWDEALTFAGAPSG
jgi:NADPH-dependent 2,4-dienoyl-CoA reductase/sulfur reductase-like enzyme